MITVELATDVQEWHKDSKRIPKNKIVQIRINYGEVDLGVKVKSFGGIWNKEKKVWELPFGAVHALGLTDRIIDDNINFSNIRKGYKRDQT